ncbi:MAG TPA: hypothetical protein VEO94_01435 [Candidatus Dormibacteraeota bacterium]|nr:hypothetical protein [Candidatus Dormibacteraeota bacterium]
MIRRRAHAYVPSGLVVALLVSIALLHSGGCGGGRGGKAPAPPPKRFPQPLFDGLWLGMTREETGRAHPIRPALTSVGKSHLVWIYDRPGEYAVELSFPSSGPEAKLARIDVHFGANQSSSQGTIAALARTLGEPEVSRRKATTNAYGDASHDEYDTIWSDADQYVFVTERVPLEGRAGAPVYYVSVKRKELVPKGPPTGYVPPPPPKGKDGKPVEEPVF